MCALNCAGDADTPCPDACLEFCSTEEHDAYIQEGRGITLAALLASLIYCASYIGLWIRFFTVQNVENQWWHCAIQLEMIQYLNYSNLDVTWINFLRLQENEVVFIQPLLNLLIIPWVNGTVYSQCLIETTCSCVFESGKRIEKPRFAHETLRP